MGVYISAVCQSLPEWILGLSIIGGITAYILVGLLVAFIVKVIKDNVDWDMFILALIFWPIVIVGGIAYVVFEIAKVVVSAIAAIFYYVAVYIVKFFAMPIVGVDKHDLKVSEDRILDTIDTKITREDNKIMKYLEYDYVPKKPVRAKKDKAVKAEKPAKDKASKKKKKRAKK